MLGCVVTVVLALPRPRLKPFFAVFERLFYVASFVWFFAVAFGLVHASGLTATDLIAGTAVVLAGFAGVTGALGAGSRLAPARTPSHPVAPAGEDFRYVLNAGLPARRGPPPTATARSGRFAPSALDRAAARAAERPAPSRVHYTDQLGPQSEESC